MALLILQRGEQEFLRVSRMALKIIQNVLSDPGVEKYRRVRTASKVGRKAMSLCIGVRVGRMKVLLCVKGRG